jgi:hypothetical protein
MAKAVHNDVIDAALSLVRANASRMVALAVAPTDHAAASAGALAEAVMAPVDFALGDGVVSGRRLTVAAKPDRPVASTGNASHVALLDDTGTRVLYVTTCPTTALAAGGSVSFGGWDIEIGDPA